MRLEILNQMGGVYLDTGMQFNLIFGIVLILSIADIVPVKSFDPLFEKGMPVMGLQQGKISNRYYPSVYLFFFDRQYERRPNSTACNAFIMTPPNAAFNKVSLFQTELSCDIIFHEDRFGMSNMK